MENEFVDAIEIKNLTIKYPKFTLDDVSFSVPFGKIVGFVGENGAGKSTTLKAIGGLVNFKQGEVKIFGKNVADLTSLEKENIGFVLDEICLPEKLNIEQFNKIFKNIFKQWSEDVFFNYLKDFGIDHTKKISELSKGMKAKLNLTIAFSHNAKLLVLDEPMNGLDPVARDEIMDILLNYISNKECAVLISSHIITDLEKICDRVVIIHEGKIFIDENKEELMGMFDVYDTDLEGFNKLDKNDVIRYKVLQDDYSVLIKKGSNNTAKTRNATLEDIIVFMIRGKKL